MATESMNILVTFKNAAKAGINRLNRDLKKVDKTVGKTTKGLKSFHSQLLAIGGLLAGGALFGGAISIFAKFDDSMRAAGAVTNATADEMLRMTEVAKEMGRETKFTASQSADALKFLGMAGFTASESIEALPGVLNLAAAGALDLATAADITTNVLTAFGLEVDQLNQVNDVLVGAFTSANVNLIEIGESFKMVGAVGKGVGADFEDLIATIGKLGNAGIKGTMAGVAMKNSIEALLNPTSKEAALMKELEQRLGGVALQVTDAEGDFIGFTEIVKQLNKANVTGIEALRLFGLRAGPGMASLMNQGKTATKELRDELKKMGGIAQKIAEEMESGIGGELRKTKSLMEGVQISVGEAFGPEVIVILEAFRGYLQGIIDTMDEMAESGALAGIGETIVTVFTKANWVLGKSVDLLQSWVALSIAAGAVLAGDMDLAREAMKGYFEEANQLAGIEPEWDGVFVGPITDEMNKARKAMEAAANPAGPIGKGNKAVKDSLEKIIPVASMETQLKVALMKLNAILEKEAAQLDADYDQGIVKLAKYYDTRVEMARQVYEKERAIIQEKLDNAEKIDEKTILNAKLFELEQVYQADVITLNAERVEAQKGLDEQLVKSKEVINRKRLKAEKAVNDQTARIRKEGVSALDTQFATELASLQTKQNSELQSINDYHAAILQGLRDQKATEIEIEQAHAAQKAAIQEQVALQQQEREQVAADQALRLQEYRIDNLKSIAGGAAQAFQALYEMMGSKSKELFYLAKAAAVAEATMNVAQGITKAMAQGGIFGIAQGVIIAAAGAAQIATIASQGFADGGMVGGRSPNKRADDKTVNVTSGEYIHDVDTTAKWGVPFMAGLKEGKLNFAYGGYVHKNREVNMQGFAGGGLVTGKGSQEETTSQDMAVNIINVTDPSTIDQYLSTSKGQDAILNVLGARPEAAQRMLKGV